MKYPSLLLLVLLPLLSSCATPSAKAPATGHDEIVKAAGEKVLQGELDSALEDLNRVISADPKNGTAYSWRSGIYLRKGNIEAALADCDAALALKPTAGNYRNRAQMRSDKKDWVGALSDVDASLKMEPESALSYSIRADIKASRRDYSGAIADYDRCLGLLKPSSQADYFHELNVYTDRGSAKEFGDDYDGAINDYTTAIRLINRGDFAPHMAASPYYKRGRTKYWKKDYQGAIGDFTSSIDLEPEQASAFYYRGRCQEAEGNLDEAISDFDVSLELKPAASTFRSRGMARRARGDLKEALDDLNEAAKLDPTSDLTLCFRGRIKIALDDPRGALADYAASLKKDPSLVFVHFDIGVVHQILQDYPKALSAYKNNFGEPVDDAIYARILHGLLLERTGKSTVSAEISPFIDSWSGAWQKSLGLYLTKKISEEELLQRATEGKRDRLAAQKCEGFYYIGISHLLAGEKSEAKAAFEKCIEVKGTAVSEKLLARAELKRL